MPFCLPRDSPRNTSSWIGKIVLWLSQRMPQDFGYYSTRWSCSALAETLAWETGIRITGETVFIGWVGCGDARGRSSARSIPNMLKKSDESSSFWRACRPKRRHVP
jgi:hypothetical protein